VTLASIQLQQQEAVKQQQAQIIALQDQLNTSFQKQNSDLINLKNTKIISVSPNPSSDIVIVEGIHSMLNVTVRDEVGRIIHAGRSASRIELNVSNWASGIYLMEFNDGKGLKQVRFIKK
jgi:hypothetical protein